MLLVVHPDDAERRQRQTDPIGQEGPEEAVRAIGEFVAGLREAQPGKLRHEGRQEFTFLGRRQPRRNLGHQPATFAKNGQCPRPARTASHLHFGFHGIAPYDTPPTPPVDRTRADH